MTKHMLCQDCLIVSDANLMVDDGEKQCRCGGDFCDCLSCDDTAKKLLAGERGGYELGLQTDGAIVWDKENGIKQTLDSECK